MNLKDRQEVSKFLEKHKWAAHRVSDDSLEELIGKEIRAVFVLFQSIRFDEQ